jgi:hypothetical protein
VRPIHRFSVPYHGLPGKGSAFRTIFRAAEVLEAKACAVVDADLRSITPEWIHLLIAPVMNLGFDYVAPYYLRHKFDGTITNNVVYPVTRALYGRQIRQPIGGDFGMSLPLIRHYLSFPVWDTDVARYGIDIWMTTTAICGGFSICQAFLGAKLHDPKDPGADLSAMLVQVLGTVFRLMETHTDWWQSIRESKPVPIMGFRYDVGLLLGAMASSSSTIVSGLVSSTHSPPPITFASRNATRWSAPRCRCTWAASHRLSSRWPTPTPDRWRPGSNTSAKRSSRKRNTCKDVGPGIADGCASRLW